MVGTEKNGRAAEAPPVVHASRLRAEISGTDYEWSGGFGAILYSRERGLQVGDTRMIGDVVFYVYLIHRHCCRWPWERPCVGWTVADPQMPWIREFKRAMFGIEDRP